MVRLRASPKRGPPQPDISWRRRSVPFSKRPISSACARRACRRNNRRRRWRSTPARSSAASFTARFYLGATRLLGVYLTQRTSGLALLVIVIVWKLLLGHTEQGN